jgi:polyamine oxidase
VSEYTRRAFLAGSSVAFIAAASGCAPVGGRTSDVIGGSVPSGPTAFVRTSWSADPFARGSYSFLAPSVDGPDARARLAEQAGRLHMAGEATSSSAPATTHGAIESGRRAAFEVMEREGSVIIIGAGFAGLAAARMLVDGGREVIVLEARDRLGGRAHTVALGDTAADLGASWVHGVGGNAVAELAAKAGSALLPFDYGRAVGGDDDALEQIGQLYDAALTGSAPHERPLSDLLPDTLTPALQWALATEISGEFGADADELSMAALDEGVEQRGGDALIDGGYSALVDHLARGTDIRLRWVVSGIEHDTSGVTVRSVDGLVIRADSAILTVPLGVLQSGAITIVPPLASVAEAALGALGSGLLDKLWLSFDEVFWNPEAAIIHWIDPDDPGLWGFWVNGYAAYGTPSLCAFVAGDQARIMAARTDREVVESAMSALRRMG